MLSIAAYVFITISIVTATLAVPSRTERIVASHFVSGIELRYSKTENIDHVLISSKCFTPLKYILYVGNGYLIRYSQHLPTNYVEHVWNLCLICLQIVDSMLTQNTAMLDLILANAMQISNFHRHIPRSFIHYHASLSVLTYIFSVDTQTMVTFVFSRDGRHGYSVW